LFPLLPLVSTTPAVQVATFSASVVDTGGKVSTGVLILVVHLHLQTSPRIFEKIRTGQMVFSGVWGKMINEKNL
jgi:hypothetical protein